MSDFTKVRIIAHYSQHCFCDKPVLPPGEPFSYRPRFNFHKAAQTYADKNSLDIFAWNTKDKSATAISRFHCQHGNPDVRISWGLDLDS